MREHCSVLFSCTFSDAHPLVDGCRIYVRPAEQHRCPAVQVCIAISQSASASCVDACQETQHDLAAGISTSGPQGSGGISRWELEGLHPLLDALVGWLGRTRRGATTNIPSGITNPSGALLASLVGALPGHLAAFAQAFCSEGPNSEMQTLVCSASLPSYGDMLPSQE